MTLHPPWFDPAMPDRSRCVLSALLQRAAGETPDSLFAVFGDGEQWCYGELQQRVCRRAAALQQLGVARGERVLVWLPNGPDMILTWFAVNVLGACFVPINTAYLGPLLAHVIKNSAARLMVAHAGLVENLERIDLAQLEHVIAIGDCPAGGLAGVTLSDETALEADAAELEPAADLMPWDLQSIIYTSGTTGPSKGVLSSYFHLYTAAEVIFGHMNNRDRIFVNGPMFHLGGTCSVYAALIHRASIAVIDGFSISDFWQQIRTTGATLTSGLLGSMAPVLANTGAEDGVENSLRMTHFYPVSTATIGLAKTFDFDYFSGFGMTELPLVLVTDLNTRVQGSCGRPRAGVDVRLVDEFDCEVGAGEVGELIVRAQQPWSLMSGYNAMPEATASAWRNGWFHTGDLFRCDAEGNFYFVDRRKDAIRRRGENISSQEVENVVYTFAAVEDAAALGVPSEHGEDDVLIVVSPKPGSAIEPLALFDYLRERLAHFMLPRYIRISASLPKTPTGKVCKNLLGGITPATWDREAAGLVVRRTDLSKKKPVPKSTPS